MRIWIVDDNKTDLKITRLVLEGMGYTAIKDFFSPLALIEHFFSKQSELPDIIISDKEMPHMNGWDLVKWLSENVEKEKPLMYILSAHINEQDYLLQKQFDFVKKISEKPFSSEVLAES